MNCKSYQNLSELDQQKFIGELVHIAQTDEKGFMMAKCLIEAGKATGKFDNVKIGHEVVYQENDLLTTTN